MTNSERIYDYDFVNYKYSEKGIRDYIEENPEKIDDHFWYHISMFQNLSEDFIRDFQDKLSWYWMSFHQKLSEDFIREFQDKLNWYKVSQYQNLSEGFLIEFIEKIVINYWLEKNKNIPRKVLKRISNLKKLLESS